MKAGDTPTTGAFAIPGKSGRRITLKRALSGAPLTTPETSEGGATKIGIPGRSAAPLSTRVDPNNGEPFSVALASRRYGPLAAVVIVNRPGVRRKFGADAATTVSGLTTATSADFTGRPLTSIISPLRVRLEV